MIDKDNLKITVARYVKATGESDPSSIWILNDGITTSVPMDINNKDYQTILELVSDKKLTIKDAE